MSASQNAGETRTISTPLVREKRRKVSRLEVVGMLGPLIVAPIAFLLYVEYMTPFMRRVTRDTPLARENAALDPSQQAWKLELMNKRTLKLHEDIKVLFNHLEVRSSTELGEAARPGSVGSSQDQGIVPALSKRLASLESELEATKAALASMQAAAAASEEQASAAPQVDDAAPSAHSEQRATS